MTTLYFEARLTGATLTTHAGPPMTQCISHVQPSPDPFKTRGPA